MDHPQTFISEYVTPSVELWKANQSEKHLAIHAITQIDVLAEVVALEILLCGRAILPRNEVKKFRDELAAREPILSFIRDAHDCHKHGILGRSKLQNVAREQVTHGQRPGPLVGHGFFADHSFIGDPPIYYSYLAFILDSGTEIKIYDLLTQAMQAWDRELVRQGL